jgi:lipopolysaccharide export system protein LptA
MLRVTTWQRKARLLIAIAAVSLAVVVVLAFKKREPAASGVLLNPADPKASIESARGSTIRFTGTKEELRIKFESAKSYQDGSKSLAGVTITTVREGGRKFVVSAKQAEVSPSDQDYLATGDVHVCQLPPGQQLDDDEFPKDCAGAGGLDVRTERVEYKEVDGFVRASGPVAFLRGRMSGNGRGFVYAKNLDILTITNDAVVHVAPDEHGAGGLDLSAPSAEFNRPNKLIRFIGGVKVTRATETIEADLGTAHLSDDEQRVESVELEGRARTTASKVTSGGLKGLEGRAITLKYGGADGQTLQQAVINGDAVIRVTGERSQADRQISAATVDASLGADGTTPTALTARDNVQLTLPGERGSPARTINAKALDAKGEEGRGLTNAHFSGGVQFRERGADIDRTARAETLDAAMAPGFSDITEARFARAVRFAEKGLTADAAAARYAVDKGTLELSGTEPAVVTPHVVNDRVSVYATRIDVTLSGPIVKASGSVKSELMPPKKDAAQASKADDAKMPSIFKKDQVVTATAAELTYDGTASKATYSGAALIWQGDTSIKAPEVTINEKTGDVTASGPVVTTFSFDQEQPDKTKKRVRSTATAKEFHYEDGVRRATYTGESHVTGPQGDMTAVKVELYLKPSGDELDRVEAYDTVTLRDQNRVTSGARMTYFSAGERYVVTGTPVNIKDNCNRETTGQKVTFDRTTDTLVVDGAERTQTKGAGSTCP